MQKNEFVVCNCCGRKFFVQPDKNEMEIVHVEKEWGYFSRKDTTRHILIFVKSVTINGFWNLRYRWRKKSHWSFYRNRKRKRELRKWIYAGYLFAWDGGNDAVTEPVAYFIYGKI